MSSYSATEILARYKADLGNHINSSLKSEIVYFLHSIYFYLDMFTWLFTFYTAFMLLLVLGSANGIM